MAKNRGCIYQLPSFPPSNSIGPVHLLLKADRFVMGPTRLVRPSFPCPHNGFLSSTLFASFIMLPKFPNPCNHTSTLTSSFKPFMNSPCSTPSSACLNSEDMSLNISIYSATYCVDFKLMKPQMDSLKLHLENDLEARVSTSFMKYGSSSHH